jgi:hypothetical protein
MSRAGLERGWCIESGQRFASVRVCGDIGLRSMVRKPLLPGRVALEGRTTERTRAAAVHRRGARAPRFAISHLSCSPPWSACTLNAALAQPQRSVNNPSL